MLAIGCCQNRIGRGRHGDGGWDRNSALDWNSALPVWLPDVGEDLKAEGGDAFNQDFVAGCDDQQ